MITSSIISFLRATPAGTHCCTCPLHCSIARQNTPSYSSSHLLHRISLDRSCLWDTWLPYVLTTLNWDSNGAAGVYVNKKAIHCTLTTNRTYWGIPVSLFPKKLTVNIYSKHSQQLCKWHDNPIQSQLDTHQTHGWTLDVVTWSPSSELPTSAWP